MTPTQDDHQLLRFLNPGPHPIPDEWRRVYHPAAYYAYEWETYWIECPEADRVMAGDMPIGPVAAGLFPLRFENHLGLTELRAFRGCEPVGAPLQLEIISPKFDGLERSYRFYAALLDELFSISARIPFTFRAPTRRGVTEAASAPTPLFTFHFLLHSERRLTGALATIHARPHRALEEAAALTPLSMATAIDSEVIAGVMSRPEEWKAASGFPLADRMEGLAPARVWQRRPHETRDTPENRFVLAFLQTLLAAAAEIPDQPWWNRVAPEERARIRDFRSLIQEHVRAPLLEGVGPMQGLPERGLRQREGYHDLLNLWNAFQSSRQPLFGILQQAIAVRDIALLYEVWVFFRLVEEMGSLLGLPAEGKDLELDLSDMSGLGWLARARFGGAGTLIYNQSYQSYSGRSSQESMGPDLDRSDSGVLHANADAIDPPRSERSGFYSYSIPLRPDFTWVVNGRSEVALDAKFRLDHPPDAAGLMGAARSEDLYKMHAYRDSLGVRAAVILYPGEVSRFYHWNGDRERGVKIPAVLRESYSGVGAIAIRPMLTDAATVYD